MDDYLGNIFTTGILGIGNGGQAQGIVEVKNDKDWFKTNLEAGVTYQFLLNGTFSDSAWNELLRLHDANGELLIERGQVSDRIGPRLEYTAPVSGTYFVGVEASANATGGYTISASITNPVLSISTVDQSLPEGNSGPKPFAFMITRSGGVSGTSSVRWSVNSSTADSSDFAGNVMPSGIVTFNPGESSKQILVDVSGDTTKEFNETFQVSLSGVTGGRLGTSTAAATIIDDEPVPVISIEPENQQQNEGTGDGATYTYYVTRTGDTSLSTSVNWKVNKIPESPEDFPGGFFPFGEISFAPGETSKPIYVKVNGDSIKEEDETFTITLYNPQGGTLNNSTAEGIIINDDLETFEGIFLTGTPGNDSMLNGGPGNDTIIGAEGNDTIDGGAGFDTAIYSHPVAAYKLQHSGDLLTVGDFSPSGDGNDALFNIEKIQFSDISVSLTVQASATSISQNALDRICELYLGFFGRVPAADGLENWIGQYKGGKTLDKIADDFYSIGSGSELRVFTGYWDFVNNTELTDRDYIRIVYRNVLGREGLDAGIDYWTTQLTSGPDKKTRGEIVSTMLDAAHSLEGTTDWGWVTNLLDDKVLMSKRVAVNWGLNYATSPEQTIAKGVAIAGSVNAHPNPNKAYAMIPIKTYDFDAAVALIGVDPANIDLAIG